MQQGIISLDTGSGAAVDFTTNRFGKTGYPTSYLSWLAETEFYMQPVFKNTPVPTLIGTGNQQLCVTSAQTSVTMAVVCGAASTAHTTAAITPGTSNIVITSASTDGSTFTGIGNDALAALAALDAAHPGLLGSYELAQGSDGTGTLAAVAATPLPFGQVNKPTATPAPATGHGAAWIHCLANAPSDLDLKRLARPDIDNPELVGFNLWAVAAGNFNFEGV